MSQQHVPFINGSKNGSKKAPNKDNVEPDTDPLDIEDVVEVQLNDAKPNKAEPNNAEPNNAEPVEPDADDEPTSVNIQK